MSDDMMTGVSSEGGQETIIFVILNLPEADEGSLKLNLRDSSVASGDLRMTAAYLSFGRPSHNFL